MNIFQGKTFHFVGTSLVPGLRTRLPVRVWKVTRAAEQLRWLATTAEPAR